MTLTTVIDLDLSHNELTTIPLDFGKQLLNLRRLNLARNRIAIIPSGVAMPPKIEELDIRFNQLMTISTAITKCKGLHSLALSFNPLTKVVPEIGTLINLTTLDLGACNFTSLPRSLGRLVGLRELLLDDNRYLTCLPVTLLNLTRVERLRCQGSPVAGELDTMRMVDVLPVKEMPPHQRECLVDELDIDLCVELARFTFMPTGVVAEGEVDPAVIIRAAFDMHDGTFLLGTQGSRIATVGNFNIDAEAEAERSKIDPDSFVHTDEHGDSGSGSGGGGGNGGGGSSGSGSGSGISNGGRAGVDFPDHFYGEVDYHDPHDPYGGDGDPFYSFIGADDALSSSDGGMVG
eukprot:CAMPEP_0119532848 /NCGR_PEP_ID=MMETSP1344-20130328/46289_1 /TAXON_ID=236787 /ORGANISM="Florenciella parvula, Strain CCMP2471" /LENGTH=346 /DNA_ID=CAMNT_0007573483 /DNA_START=496 /DNA_END=1533 /DNA_ORIENTATION=-